MSVEPFISCVDVGSTLMNKKTGRVAFGWCARQEGTTFGDTRIDHFVREVSAAMRLGKSVALGFEAPLHLPMPADYSSLSRPRKNEGDRSWSAPAGGYVATLWKAADHARVNS